MKDERAEELYRKSIEVLKSVQIRKGGCMATPSGKRYPYIYPRDNAICVLGFVSAGLFGEARRALKFVLSSQKKSGAFPQRVDRSGRDASYKPIQIDGTALSVYALSKYVKESGDTGFAEKNRERVKRAMKYIEGEISRDKGLVFTPNSIHEFPPMEEGFEIWANAACYAAFRKARSLVEDGRLKRRYEQNAERIKKGIEKYMWNSRLKSYVKTIRRGASSSVDTDIDSAVLGLCEFGVFRDRKARALSTIERLERELWNRELGGLCRYPKYKGRNNGGWGPWPHFTLMLCRHYIRLGNKNKARKILEWVERVAYKGMLPEHISTKKEFEEYVQDFRDAGILRKDRMVMIRNARKHPMFRKRGIAYITLPLAWPHAEFIITWNLYKKRFGKD